MEINPLFNQLSDLSRVCEPNQDLPEKRLSCPRQTPVVPWSSKNGDFLKGLRTTTTPPKLGRLFLINGKINDTIGNPPTCIGPKFRWKTYISQNAVARAFTIPTQRSATPFPDGSHPEFMV